MKIKKLDLLDFKQDELSREDISSVKAGAPIDGKPPGASSGGGSGGENVVCYYDLDGSLLYCTEREEDDLPPVQL
jgi:hypothetical protein